MAARDRNARFRADRFAAFQHLRDDFMRQHVDRHADERERENRLAAHRVDIGERVGRGDAAEVERIVDDRHEEIGRRDDRLLVVELVDGGIVGGVVADEQIGKRRQRRGALEQVGQHAGRDLAAAAAAVGKARETG
jgi:hypothetical protein